MTTTTEAPRTNYSNLRERTRRLAKMLDKRYDPPADQTRSPLTIYKVTSLHPTDGMVNISEDNGVTELPVRHLGSYGPEVNDPVMVYKNGADWLVLGSVKRGQSGIEQRDFNTNPITPGETSGVIRDFVINPIVLAELANNSVNVNKIVDGAVERVKIAEAAINAALIDVGAITNTKIANDAITTPKIATNSIITDHLAGRIVAATNIIGGTITAFEIATRTITADRIATNSITATEIATGAILIGPAGGTSLVQYASGYDPTTKETPAGAQTKANTAQTNANNYTNSIVSPINTQVNLWKYLNTTFIDGGQIYTNTITANQIAVNTITAGQIATGTITATQIAANAITTVKLDANAVTAAKIATGTITATQIATGTLTSASGVFGTISASDITTGTMNAARINGGTITGVNITGVTITGGTLQTATSGSRIVLSAGASQQITFYSTTSNVAGYVGWRSSMLAMDGTADVRVAAAGNLYLSSDTGNIRFEGTSLVVTGATGTSINLNNNVSTQTSQFIAFFRQSNTSRSGWVGFGSSTNNNLSITNQVGSVVLTASGMINSMTIRNNSAAVGGNVHVNSAGNLFFGTSSRRFKKNIRPMTLAEAERILDAEAVRFEGAGQGDRPGWTHYGYIAEQIRDDVDVRLVDFELDEKGNPTNEVGGVHYTQTIPHLKVLIAHERERRIAIEEELEGIKAQLLELTEAN